MQVGKIARHGASALLTLAVLIAPAAHAASCSVTAPTLNFGGYDPLSMSPTDSSTNIIVSCSRTVATGAENVTYTLSLSAGTGSFAARTMLKGATTLNYNLYTTALRDAANIWGDGTGGSTTLSASLPTLDATFTSRTANHAIYGRIPARQDVPIGSYAASVVLTINY